MLQLGFYNEVFINYKLQQDYLKQHPEISFFLLNSFLIRSYDRLDVIFKSSIKSLQNRNLVLAENKAFITYNTHTRVADNNEKKLLNKAQTIAIENVGCSSLKQVKKLNRYSSYQDEVKTIFLSLLEDTNRIASGVIIDDYQYSYEIKYIGKKKPLLSPSAVLEKQSHLRGLIKNNLNTNTKEKHAAFTQMDKIEQDKLRKQGKMFDNYIELQEKLVADFIGIVSI